MLAVVLAEVADGGLDARGLAMLGVLAAVGTALRPLGAGHAGFEPIWLVIILGGRALGPGFGFSLGSVTLFSSALVTGGVGPWLPFQMIAAGWVGLGAGLLSPLRGRAAAHARRVRRPRQPGLRVPAQPVVLAVRGRPGRRDLVRPGAEVSENLGRWLVFGLLTSLGYDLPRAVLTVALLLVAGGPVLRALRRATRRAAFGVPVRFEAPS